MMRKLVGALVALAVLTGGLWAAADKADKDKAADKVTKDKVVKDKAPAKDDCQATGVLTHAPKSTVKVPEGHHHFIVTDAKGMKHRLTCHKDCKVFGPRGGKHDCKWLGEYITKSKTPVHVRVSGKHQGDGCHCNELHVVAAPKPPVKDAKPK